MFGTPGVNKLVGKHFRCTKRTSNSAIMNKPFSKVGCGLFSVHMRPSRQDYRRNKNGISCKHRKT